MSSDKEHVLLPLSAQAMDTIMHLSRLAHGSTMHLSPFAYEHVADGEMREIRGWVLDTPGDAPAYCLPVGVSLFDGLSIAKCDLLVIGRHTAEGLAGQLFQNTYGILTDSPCPVISI